MVRLFKFFLWFGYALFALGALYEVAVAIYQLTKHENAASLDRVLTTGFVAAGFMVLACGMYLLAARIKKLEQAQRSEQK